MSDGTSIEWTIYLSMRGLIMPKWGGQFGEINGQWKGGRVLASNGYILIRVGVNHHLSDVRGYAYEHRIVAEQKIGRRLESGEVVHHKDGDKTNNNPDNIDVFPSISHHSFEHRKVCCDRRRPGEINKIINCMCGCGSSFPKFDNHGRPRKFVTGHNMMRGTNNV